MKPLVDLRVRHERVPSQAKLETTYKRSLITASLRFELTKSNDKISIDGSIEAKIPLKNAWRFEGSSLWSPACEVSLVDFEVSTEREAGSNRVREWRREGGELKFREFENGAIRREATYVLQNDLMPISSPLLLPSSIQSTVSGEEESYGCLLVVGSRFAALRLDPAGVSATKNFRGAVMTVRQPLRRADWLALPWHQARGFDLDLTRDGNEFARVAADVPVLGSLSLNF